MSRNQRIGLLLAALAVAVVAVVVAVASGGGDDEGSQAAQTTQETTDTGSATGTGTDTETDEQPHETVPAEPAVTRIRIEGGKVVGGPADIKVTKGDTVRIVVSADAHDDIHLHGYDIEKPVEPGTARALQVQGEHRGHLRDREPRGRGRGQGPPRGQADRRAQLTGACS